ncbi:hypothetical protein DFH29DRAFT_1000378 [Suillus ampliporus]|nr:hypothetical protein DFH29DRAFT_1000378 [Suillus ampliporus]
MHPHWCPFAETQQSVFSFQTTQMLDHNNDTDSAEVDQGVDVDNAGVDQDVGSAEVDQDDETLEDFGSQGVGIDNGYWDEYKLDMAVLLWDNCTTMHSKMKKVAHPIVLAHYKILPPDVDNKNDYEWEVCDNIKTLLQDDTFLWDGVDAQDRTNNLANEALGSFYMSYFYQGKNALVKTFPDLFADAVPKGAVALVATALAAAIDKYKTGTYKQMKFVAELHQPIYDNVIKLYGDVKKDHYHAKKCQAAQKKWACTAGILTCDDPNRRHDLGLKLQLD